MTIDFIYQKQIDLVFHILAHVHVCNASDLFSEPYIEKMRSAIPTDTISFPPSAAAYYNQNFDRLGIINFLPFSTRNLEELIQSLRGYHGFREEDKEFFVEPFVQILNRHSTKYFEFWDKQFDQESANRLLIEERLRAKIDPYRFLFDSYQTSAKAWLSFSITKNGRGFQGIPGCFSAAAPYPFSQDRESHTFFVLLHEYTHQFTDALLHTRITMGERSHELSEKVVILTDYFLIKHTNPADISPYFAWLYPQGDAAGIDEEVFLHIFQVPDHIQQQIDELTDRLLHGRYAQSGSL